MWIVNIVSFDPIGYDPFIAQTKPAIKRGLDDLYEGKYKPISSTETCVRALYTDNVGIELNIVAYKTEYYK